MKRHGEIIKSYLWKNFQVSVDIDESDWEMSKRMTKELVLTTLKRAMIAQNPTLDLIHHSDRGSQYASNDYQALLRENEITTSMSRKGNCYDNACIESFHAIIKKELIFHNKYKRREEARRSIIEYIVSLYNYKRIYSTNNYMSPNHIREAILYATAKQGGLNCYLNIKERDNLFPLYCGNRFLYLQ